MNWIYVVAASGESIPIRLFLAGYEMTPTMKDVNKKYSVRYYLNLVLIDEEERRYFKQQVSTHTRTRACAHTHTHTHGAHTHTRRAHTHTHGAHRQKDNAVLTAR